MTRPPVRKLSAEFLDRIDHHLVATDALLEQAFPGDDGSRQPVHTVYVPANRYSRSLTSEWGGDARWIAGQHGGLERIGRLVGLSPDLAAEVAPLVETKLRTEPIEDLRIDFEDGYTEPDETQEMFDASRVAGDLGFSVRDGQAPPFAGLRFKCLEAPTRRRGLRTLNDFVGVLTIVGFFPEHLVLTLPKVSTVAQVEAMVEVCAELETTHRLPAGRLRFEIQVETPQLILGPDGRVPVRPPSTPGPAG